MNDVSGPLFDRLVLCPYQTGQGQSKSLIDRLLSGVMATSLLSLLYSLSYFAVRKLYRDVRFIKSKYYDG